MPRETVPDMTGRYRIRMTFNSAYEISSNSLINKMFSQDSHLSLQLGELKDNEPILIKEGSWQILNEEKYLKIILHDQNGVNLLVFKSTNQIFNTRYRNLFSINFSDSENNIQLFLNSLPEDFSLDTSENNYHTDIADFTGLNINDNSVKIGRGVIEGEYGTFCCYYDDCFTKKLTQEEINNIYQEVKDDRVLPELGQILFSSNIDGVNYKIYEMLEDGTDSNLKYSVGSYDMLNAQYEHSKDGFTVATNGIATYRTSAGVLKTCTGLTSNIRTAILTCDKKYLIFDHDNNAHGKDISVNGSLFDFNSLSPGTNAGYINNYAGYINNLPLASHPTSNIKFLMTRISNTQPNTLVQRNFSTHTEVQIFATPYSSTTYNQKIFGARYSKDGSKIGFNVYYNESGSDYRAYICNTDGSNLILLAQSSITTPTDFCAFSPDDSKVLLSKTTSGVGYTNKKQLFIRDLNTNEETQITFSNSNNQMADWKAAN